MLKAKVGHSYHTNPFQSGVETASNAIKGLTSPKLGILFSSSNYDNSNLVKGVGTILSQTPFIGATSAGGILLPEGHIYAETGYSGMMILDDPNTIVGVAGEEKKESARKTGYQVALAAVQNANMKTRPTYVYMIATPGEEEEYLKGIQDVVGRIPIFGGTATDEKRRLEWQIFCNDHVFQEGCVVAVLYTNKRLSLEFTGAYNQTTNVGIITRMDRKRTVVEINHKNALQQYAEWIHKQPNELIGDSIYYASVTHPLGIKTPTGDLVLIRQPIFGNTDQTLETANDTALYTAVIQLEANTNDLIVGARAALNVTKVRLQRKAGVYILSHSLGRKMVIGDRISEIHQAILQEAQGVPFIVSFTNSEFGYASHTANCNGSLMLSFAALSEE